MKLKYIVCLLIAATLLSASAYAAGSQIGRSYSGTFTGSNSPTINVGGNCPPLNVRIDVTGNCSGTSTKGEGCSQPIKITDNYGYFLSRSAGASVGGSCFVGSCSVSISNCCSKSESTGGYGGLYPSCSCTVSDESLYMGGGYTSSCAGYGCSGFSCGITTYYIPCTKDPQAIVNGTTWKYTGLVKNTTTTSIFVGTNSNPSSNTLGYIGTKIPVGNLKLGANAVTLSALEKNAFSYTVYWTEETVSGSGDADGDGYYTNSCTLGNDCNDYDPNVNPGHLEVPGNGIDDNCDGVTDTLYINSVADLTNNCPYDTATRTYSCTGWTNIEITNDISIPTDCGTFTRCSSTYTGPCTSRNIIFTATNRFVAKNIHATGHTPGSVTITAKTINATSINTYGGTCTGGSCSCSVPSCGNGGGAITLTADNVNVMNLNANDGAGSGGSGGAINIKAKTTDIDTIQSSGAGYYCSYNYGATDGAGSGGSVSVKSDIAKINTIAVGGGGGSYCSTGGSAGSSKIVANSLTLGSISANGGSPSGSGGDTKIYTDAYTVNSITQNGASGSCGSSCRYGGGSGGSVRIFSDINGTKPTFSASGGSYDTCGSCTCGYAYAPSGALYMYKRSASGFFVFETNMSDASYNSYQMAIKDSITGLNVNNAYGAEFNQDGVIKDKYIKALVGRLIPLKLKLGTEYNLVLKHSSEIAYNVANCGISATCDTIYVPFTRY